MQFISVCQEVLRLHAEPFEDKKEAILWVLQDFEVRYDGGGA